MASFVPPPPAAPPPAFIPSVRQMQVRQLIDAVRQVESGNREGAKSKKGALGPMQVMPETLKNPGYGLKPATDYSEQGLDRFGQEYLQAMIQHYGDVRDALVAYNWGPGNANRWISRGRKDAALPAETRNYLNRVGLDYSRRLKNRDASILEAEEMLSASASPMQERPAPVAAAQEPEAAPAPAPAPEQEPDWISPAMGGSFPVSERKRSDPEGAISLLAQAQRFLNPGPRPAAFADGGAVSPTEASIPEGGIEELLGSGGGSELLAGGSGVKKLLGLAEQAVGSFRPKHKDVTKRVPELTAGAKKLLEGELTREEYEGLVNTFKPVRPYEYVPLPASREEAIGALTSNKKDKYGGTLEIPAGEKTHLRLDIPAYTDHGVWINSIHRPETGLPTVYSSTSSATDVRMVLPQERFLRVAAGESKIPLAVMEGKWNPMTDEQAFQRANEALKDPANWRQIGMDPERHGYFYDRATMQPIVGADEVIQVGPLVVGRGVRYGDKKNFKYADGGAVRVPEGEAEPDWISPAMGGSFPVSEEVSAGVGSLSDRARSMFAVSPLDYRPAARGARAAAERVGEELSEPGRVPAADTRQRLVRMAQDALEAGKVAGKIGYELLVPQDLTDVGLMVAMGPGGRLARAGIGAALMAMDPDEAEAGKIDALRAAAARIRQSPLPAEERATRAFSRKPPVVDPNEVDPYPGVFGMSPAQKAAEASTRIEQESPWLKTLFGVNRADLYEMSKRKGDRPGEIAEPPNPRGSELAARVMTPRNAQRLQDELAEAQKYPELFRPMHAWYTMDPAYQRLLQIMPKDEADTAYARLNSFVATASPMSEPLTEIPRGLAANMMENAGLFDIFRRVGGKNAGQRAEALRGEGVPDEEIKRVLGLVPALERFPGHSAHSTHSEMMGKLRQNEYKVISDAPKVRVYSQASGVPGHPYGFQTDSPIVDAGITRNIGFARVSGSQTPGDSLAAAPYRDIRPWWAQQVAGPLGLEAVPAQAINWATSSPATGVGTSLGATKLELLARYIGQRSMELGVDPFVFRDLVLSGKAFADGGAVSAAGTSIPEGGIEELLSSGGGNELLAGGSGVKKLLGLAEQAVGSLKPAKPNRSVPSPTEVKPEDNLKMFLSRSAVRTPEGEPLRVYHGTSKDIEDFKSFNMGKRGGWFSENPKEASSYAETNDSQGVRLTGKNWEKTNSKPRVIPVYLNIEKPYTMTDDDIKSMQRFKGSYRSYQSELFNKLKSEGYDGVKFGDGTWVAFYPEQVKSAIGNAGTFDPKSKNLMKADGGEVTVRQGIGTLAPRAAAMTRGRAA